MATRVFFFVCQLIVVITGYDSFDDGYNNDVVGLSNSLSGVNVKVLPIVHKLVNINNINNAGNLTINDIKKVLKDVDTNIDSLNNAQSGDVVFNDISILSDTIKKSKKLLSDDSSVVRIGPVNSAIKKTYDVVKTIVDHFSNSVKLTNSEKDLYLDVVLSGGMALLHSRLKDVLGLSDVKTLSDQEPKVQLLNEVTFAKALSKGFVKLRAVVAAGTKYAKGSKIAFLKGGPDTTLYNPVHTNCLKNKYNYCVPPAVKALADDTVTSEVVGDPNDSSNDLPDAPNAEIRRPGSKKKLCLFSVKREYCVHQEKSL